MNKTELNVIAIEPSVHSTDMLFFEDGERYPHLPTFPGEEML